MHRVCWLRIVGTREAVLGAFGKLTPRGPRTSGASRGSREPRYRPITFRAWELAGQYSAAPPTDYNDSYDRIYIYIALAAHRALCVGGA